jgi:ligand-binding sensor domain-containing protein
VVATSRAQSPGQQPGWQWIDHVCVDCFASVDVGGTGVRVGTVTAGVVHFDRDTGRATRHTVANGLGGTSGRVVTAAEDGHVWVATANYRDGLHHTGVSHFDGESWERFDTSSGLPSNEVLALAALPNGEVWAGTMAGVAHYDGSAWAVHTIADGLPADFVTDVAIASNGEVYVATPNGMGKLAGSVWTTLPAAGLPSPGFANVAVSSAEEVWALAAAVPGADCSGGEVARFGVDPGGLPGWTTYDLGLCGRDHDRSTRLQISADGRVWASRGVTVQVFESGTWRAFDHAREHARAAGALPAPITIDPDGDVWLPLVAGGLAHWDGRRWETLRTGLGRANLIPFNVEVGRNGHVWVGNMVGLSKASVVEVYDGAGWRSFGGPDIGLDVRSPLGVVPRALDIGQDGIVWVGVDSAGLAWFDGTTWHSATISDTVRAPDAPADWNGRILAVASDHHGGAWVASAVGAAHFDGSSWSWLTTADGLPRDDVRTIEVHPVSGDVWFGTDLGVARWDGARWAEWTAADGLAPGGVEGITIDPTNDSTWFVSGDVEAGGVSRFDGRTWTVYTAADGLPSGAGWSIHVAAGGDVWLAPVVYGGPTSGVAHFDGRAWRVYTMADGLINDGVFDVVSGADGRVWVATMLGVSELRTRPIEPTPDPSPSPARTRTLFLPAVARGSGPIDH